MFINSLNSVSYIPIYTLVFAFVSNIHTIQRILYVSNYRDEEERIISQSAAESGTSLKLE